MKVGSQALSATKSMEKLQETSCPFGGTCNTSDPVFWSRAQDSSLSLRSLGYNETTKNAKRTKTPHPSIHAEFDQFSATRSKVVTFTSASVMRRLYNKKWLYDKKVKKVTKRRLHKGGYTKEVL